MTVSVMATLDVYHVNWS